MGIENGEFVYVEALLRTYAEKDPLPENEKTPS